MAADMNALFKTTIAFLSGKPIIFNNYPDFRWDIA